MVQRAVERTTTCSGHVTMARNTGRYSRAGRLEEAKGHFLKAKNRGGNFSPRKPQCNHYNGNFRCISAKHSWFTIHQSYGMYDFGWYTWDRTIRPINLRQMEQVRDRG